jgi:hypothetical protein
MTYNYTITQDGQTYKAGEDVPDLGSLRCTSHEDNIRHYEGLQADYSKLPHYVDTGSSCLMLDTGKVYKYEKLQTYGTNSKFRVKAGKINGIKIR